VDGATWADYEVDLERKLEALHDRVHRGAYQPQPSRRVYIPKADGRQRPLAVAAVEDKIVQGAAAMVLSAIYEVDFLGFSYGFRPGRGQHDALDALVVGISSRKVNWILDADIRSFFDMVDQKWMIRFVEHRIGDPRIIRLIQKWMKAGVLEDGEFKASERGTGQGSVISPLLANIYLHYAFDLWANRWRQREVTGDMIILGYADDTVVGFEHETRRLSVPRHDAHARRGTGSPNWLRSGSLSPVSYTLGQAFASPSNTRGRSRMRASRTYGSVRGAPNNGRPYGDSL
jgi:RNA-directed DNA polymerase